MFLMVNVMDILYSFSRAVVITRRLSANDSSIVRWSTCPGNGSGYQLELFLHFPWSNKRWERETLRFDTTNWLPGRRCCPLADWVSTEQVRLCSKSRFVAVNQVKWIFMTGYLHWTLSMMRLLSEGGIPLEAMQRYAPICRRDTRGSSRTSPSSEVTCFFFYSGKTIKGRLSSSLKNCSRKNPPFCLPWPKYPPSSRRQRMCGGGCPLDLHTRLTLDPSRTIVSVLDSLSMMSGGTVPTNDPFKVEIKLGSWTTLSAKNCWKYVYLLLRRKPFDIALDPCWLGTCTIRDPSPVHCWCAAPNYVHRLGPVRCDSCGLWFYCAWSEWSACRLGPRPPTQPSSKQMHRKTKLIKQTLFNDCPNIGTCPKRESCSTLARPSVACFVYLLWLLRKEAAGSERKRTVLCLLFPPQKTSAGNTIRRVECWDCELKSAPFGVADALKQQLMSLKADDGDCVHGNGWTYLRIL